MKKCIILFSGGLDSLLVVKIMKELGFNVTAVFLKLPFLNYDYEFMKKFCGENNVDFKIIDCSKGKNLEEYLSILKKPLYGRGVSFNPCIDCKIFMFKKIKEIAKSKKIELIVSGEVLDERPFSQNSRAFKIIDKVNFLEGRILRPLSGKLLEKTDFEIKGIINRNDLYSIKGRRRNIQINLAKKFKIDFYPQPSGGCLLCERIFKKRFEILIKENLITSKTRDLIKIGRHFFKKNCWFVVGRNEKENEIIEKFKKSVKSDKNKPAVYYLLKEQRDFAKNLQESYKKGGIRKYSDYKI